MFEIAIKQGVRWYSMNMPRLHFGDVDSEICFKTVGCEDLGYRQNRIRS